MKKFYRVLILLSLAAQGLWAQHTDGKWMIGVRGSGNLWVNDRNVLKTGPSGELEISYGLSRYISLGLGAGYEVLKSGQNPQTAALPYDYLRIDGIPASLIVKARLSPDSKVKPYIYVGAGGMVYRRRTGSNIYVPDDKWRSSIHIPVGLGLEAFLSDNVAFNIDLGYRLMDEWTDYAAIGKRIPGDTYASAKAGLNFFLGSSDSDDDDMDGLTNGEEKKLGTNMNNADTDDDGLKDGEEVSTYRSNPTKVDTDGDGLNDGSEVMNYKTDPRKADSDGDSLSDGDEVTQYKTDPLKADTDGDGLYDDAEVLVLRSDPLKEDTDGDGLNDGEEVNRYRTDPIKADTDGGTVSDGVEVRRGSNPLSAKDDIKEEIKVEVGKAIVLEGIVFKSGSSVISPESEAILEKAFNTLNQNAEITVEIRGHTDNTGSRATNERLSTLRAEAVKAWLVNQGIAAYRISTKGFGPDLPIAPNTTREGRQKNRRIEFFRTK